MIGSIGADLNPIFGIRSIPCMGLMIWHALPMNAREVLAANFQKLRDATPSLSLPKDIVKVGAATNGTIGRIMKRQIGPSIDTVETLAAAYGLQAWQLLSPALHVSKGRNGKPVVSIPGAWPFSSELQAALESLNTDQASRCEKVIRAHLGLATGSQIDAERDRLAAARANKSRTQKQG